MRRTTTALRVEDLSGPAPAATLVANMLTRPDLGANPLAAAVAALTESELEQLAHAACIVVEEWFA